MTPPGQTRRELLKLAGYPSVASLVGCVEHAREEYVDSANGEPSPHDESATIRYSAREAFDRADERFHENGGLLGATNDSDGSSSSGSLAWGESYVLQAYLLMYRAHGDESYLDEFVEHADAVLENRDSVRGVTDYRGRSRPAWRSDAPYTVGSVALSDPDGNATLEVRTTAANPDRATATVTDGTTPETFGLVVTNPVGSLETAYDELSMDPARSDYAVARINREGYENEGPNGCRVTVADLRDSPGAAGIPATGTFECECPHYVYAVHTGMISFPLASFGRLLASGESSHTDTRYVERARRYHRAAERAVRVHESQWRETDDGRGYYVFEPGSPTIDESTSLPHNQSLALGRTLIQLAAATGTDSFADRAHKLARTFDTDVRRDDSEAAIWSYHWTEGAYAAGWPATDPESEYRPWTPGIDEPLVDRPEDISHGHIDVGFATLAATSREAFEGRDPVFTESDMVGFGRTYTENVATEVDGAPAARKYVNGTGPRTGDHTSSTALWNGLAPWNDRVIGHSSAIYDEHGMDIQLSGDELLGIAMLNYWAERPGDSPLFADA